VYGTGYYDIEAKAEGTGARNRDEFRPMLQALLADRFHLKYHRDMREMPVYALVPDKNGAKLKESAPDAAKSIRIGVNGRNQLIVAPKISMDQFARTINNAFGVTHPVLNKTGLAGAYDIKLEATPEFRMTGPDPELKNISVFDAIRQQLGLRLEPQKATMELLIIDHVESPSAN
jgi:uncharacterized protein (TIGR03435 family)